MTLDVKTGKLSLSMLGEEMNVDCCITAAGIGSRFIPFSSFANKALAPVPFKPLICELIDLLPSSSDVHIVTGYGRDDLIHIVKLFCPEKTIYEQRNHDFAKTGMGDSILPILEKQVNPLCIFPNDGIYKRMPPLQFDVSIDFVLGFVRASDVDNPSDYLLLSADTDGYLQSFKRNELIYDPSLSHQLVFTGFMYIRDPQGFAGLLKACESPRELYSPFDKIIEYRSKCQCIEVQWTDCGTYPKYKAYISSISSYDFSKEEETLLLERGKPVVKIFKDKSVAIKRVTKAQSYPKAFPECTLLPSGSGYYYDYISGNTLYSDCSVSNLRRLLSFLDHHLWSPREDIILEEDAKSFYEEKTKSRIALLQSKYDLNKIKRINQSCIPPSGLIPDFNYKLFVNNSVPSPIHGDLQYDNVLINADEIVLLDWRHEFGNNNLYGDLYYDFSKLIGGILINYQRIKDADFHCELSDDGTSITWSYIQDSYSEEHLLVLSEFIISKGFNLKHCWQLLSLIYMNMAPLHHYPFDLMLLAMSHDIYEKHR